MVCRITFWGNESKSTTKLPKIFCRDELAKYIPESDEDSESVTRKPNRRISFILRPRDKFI